MIYIITRHPAAAEWLAKQGFDSAKLVTHADEAFWKNLQKGDVVVGTLPIHLAAKACTITEKPFGFLSLMVPAELRGAELTVDQMEELGASISWFDVASATAPGVGAEGE